MYVEGKLCLIDDVCRYARSQDQGSMYWKSKPHLVQRLGGENSSYRTGVYWTGFSYTVSKPIYLRWIAKQVIPNYILITLDCAFFKQEEREARPNLFIQCPPKVWRQPVIFLLPSITTPCPIKFKKTPMHFQTL